MYFIYTLADPRTSSIGYIGMTVNVPRRYRDHCACRPIEGIAKNEWIAMLKQEGLVPDLKILETTESEQIAKERELYWITYYKKQGIELYNTQNVNATWTKRSNISDLNPLGVQIIALCELRDMSLYRLAKRAGMKYETLYHLMRGKKPKRETVLRVCKALGCTQEEARSVFMCTDYRFPSPDELREDEEKPAA